MAEIFERLQPLELRDARGRTCSIAQVTRGARAVLLVFLRHFACPTCSRTVLALAERQSELRALGATVVVIGAGSSAALDAFSERVGLTGLDFVALTDERRRAHELAGLVRSKWGTYGPRAVLRSIALYAEGHFAPRRRDDGDVDQQGGALLFIDGELVLEHRNHFVGDDLDPGDVIDVLLREHARHAGQPGC